MSELRQKYYVGITKGNAWRAKTMVDEVVEGDAVKQYSLLWSYAEELKRQCGGTVPRSSWKGLFHVFHHDLRDSISVLMDAKWASLKVADLS
ncbi:unnamed protein product [Lathyrus sativus]|nr:unnamed protein product [Lathyrus sativus]